MEHFPTVSIVNSSNVRYSAIYADKACGVETRLIYYMKVGQLLSRAFTSKDTHTPGGELIVGYTNGAKVDAECTRRTAASSALLGFSAPCFTYGAVDTLLPAEANAHLRTLLQQQWQPGDVVGLESSMASLTKTHGRLSGVYIPEVLAALVYLHRDDDNSVDTERRKGDKVSVPRFQTFPLETARFGCSYDMSLSVRGYDMAAKLVDELHAFKLGTTCEQGFMPVSPADLKVKQHWEFGVDGEVQTMPDLRDFRVSVMYRTFAGDAKLFNVSLAATIKHIPRALEAVIVVVEADEELFRNLVEPYRDTAPFPIRIVTEPRLLDGPVQQKFSKLRADIYTRGDFILHLDSDVVVFEDVTYAHIFHLGKPVLPFRRYEVDTFPGRQITMCWQNGTSFAVGEEVVHEFSIFNTHVYPRSTYPAARQFIEQRHRMSFVQFMSTRRGSCMHPNTMTKWTMEERTLLFSDFNFIGAFLWYHMHESVYWLAASPYDTQPDDWRTDLIKYAWVCQANGRHAPSDAEGLNQYAADLRMVNSNKHCQIVNEHWKRHHMRDPATRTQIDTTSAEWQSP